MVILLGLPIAFKVSPKLRNGALLLLYLTPTLVLGGLIARYGVNVPAWDEWELVKFFDSVYTRHAPLQSLWSLHNEHRIVVPRLVFGLSAWLTHWNVKLVMYLSWALAIAYFGLIGAIAARFPHRRFLHLTNIITALLLFSPNQFENWFWGMGLCWFITNFFVVLAIFILAYPAFQSPKKRLLGAGLCCVAASFSMAQGLFSWFALIPLLLLLPRTRRQKVYYWGGWFVAFVVTATVYLWGYTKPPGHPDVLFFLKHPGATLDYLLVLLGASVNRITSPALLGGVLLSGFLGLNGWYGYHWWRDRERVLLGAIAPWLALAWFVMFFAVLTTLGRAGFGPGQATSPRYISLMVLLPIALLQALRTLISVQPLQKPAFIRFNLPFWTTLFAVLSLALVPRSLDQTANIFTQRAIGQHCVNLVNFAPNSCLETIYLSSAIVRDNMALLAKWGWRDVPQTVPFATASPTAWGAMHLPTTDQILTLPPSMPLPIAGWVQPQGDRHIPQVIFLRQDAQPTFFAYGHTDPAAPDRAVTIAGQRITGQLWQSRLPLTASELGPGEHQITAWVYDDATTTFQPLAGTVRVQVKR